MSANTSRLLGSYETELAGLVFSVAQKLQATSFLLAL